MSASMAAGPRSRVSAPTTIGERFCHGLNPDPSEPVYLAVVVGPLSHRQQVPLKSWQTGNWARWKRKDKKGNHCLLLSRIFSRFFLFGEIFLGLTSVYNPLLLVSDVLALLIQRIYHISSNFWCFCANKSR